MNTMATKAFDIILPVALVIFSAMIHEIAHGWVAYKCGDETAKRAGRLSFNPARHLDPFGSVILPIIMAVAGGPVFAFAKPVPYNPNNLRNPRRDEVLVAFAGPASNLLLALIGAGVFQLLIANVTTLSTQSVMYYVLQVIATYIYVNLILMFFNLIPLPPLDGSAIISPLLSGKAREGYYKVQAYSMPILLALLYLVPMVLNVDPLGAYLNATAGGLYDLLIG